jgi:hypothetical protein
MRMARRNTVLWIFSVVLCLVYGIIASGQILGFAKVYKPLLAIPLAIGLAGLFFILYQRSGSQFFDSFNHGTEMPRNFWLITAFAVSGFLLYALLVFYPLVHWPYSPISMQLNKDAGLYHFPKAVEMVSTGSAWDLSISYGEYPFGYESMIAMSFLINHAGWLIGTVHAIISLFLLLVMALLIFQRTKIPQAPVFFLLGILFLGYQLARNFDSNIWWIFWPQISLIGKNDVFLAAALLAVILHTPTSRQGPFFPFGLALASMVAISIKPNAALVVVVAWLVMLFFLWSSRKLHSYWKQLLLSGFTILPGGLWVVRNLIAQGSIISPDIMQISAWSISSNLTNPFFYKYIPQHLFIVLAIIVLAAFISFFRRTLRFDVIIALVLLITFAATPASAFLGSTKVPAQIAWRFAMALLAYILLLLLIVFEPIILAVYRWIARKNLVALPLALVVLGFGVWCVWTQRDLLKTHLENKIVLNDSFRQPVGVDGYHSVYDYVQKNVHNSVVIVENGLPYYLYDPGFTNSVTHSRPADYYVCLQNTSTANGGYPESLGKPEWNQTWRLVYEDTRGRVYKRR